MAANIKTKGATLRAAPSLRRGTKQIRTAVAGFADLCLTARPWYRVLITSAKVLLFLELARVDRVFLSFALHFVPVESTDKCKIKQSFCSTLLLMFQTFVFVWCNVFCCSLPSFGLSNTCSAPPTTRSLFRKCTCLPPQPPTRTRSARPLFFVFCLHLITRICKNIKNSLIHLRDKILLGERLLIETMKDKLKNIVQIEHTRHRSIGGFAANLMAAMAA